MLRFCYACTYKVFLIPVLLIISWAASAQDKKPGQTPLSVVNGRLVYTPDSLGNRIPDFSYCGYMAGEKAIPDVPVRVVVPLQKGDATWLIQTALDYVASLPADKNGIRGAVLLQKGTYEIEGALSVNASE